MLSQEIMESSLPGTEFDFLCNGCDEDAKAHNRMAMEADYSGHFFSP